MKKLFGLLLTCVVVPGFYAGGMYYLATHHVFEPRGTVEALRLAVLIAVPLVVSGAVKWWDVWVKPAPKLGGYWTPVQPSAYAVRLFRGHGIIALICVILQLYVEQQEITDPVSRLEVSKTRDELDQLERRILHLEYFEHTDEARSEAFKLKMHSDLLRERLAVTGQMERTVWGQSYQPTTILMLCAAGTSLYVPRRYGRKDGQPITQG